MTATVVLRGGRVVDPASGLDAVADVVITGDRVDAVLTGEPRQPPPSDAHVVDVSGLVVAPGFVDLHSHAQTVAGHRLQALDGVTTALELEAGASPVRDAYAQVGAHGRPLNYGFSASWALARMSVVAGFDITGAVGAFLKHIGDPAWQRPATAAEVERIVGFLDAELANGALGIGMLMGYAPLVDPAEYVAVAAVAARAGRPTYTHARELVEVVPDTPIDGAEEIVCAASETGAHMHYCHVNSTSRRHVDRVLDLVTRARANGARVSTEAYPYGAGSTGIGAYFLDPDRLGRWGLTPSSIRYMPTGERVADVSRLRELREQDPGGLAVIDFFDEADPADRELLHRPLLFPDSIVASDAMPLTWLGGGRDELAWPLPPNAVTHPRTTGTFCRSIRVLHREHGLPLLEVIRRMTSLPADVLAATVPAMRRKGRLTAGADADVTIFDPAAVTDQATYEDSTRPSSGIAHVLVNGEFVVRDGSLVLDAMPGRAVRG